MRNPATFFFATGAIFVLIGMGWGIQMSATQDHSLSAAHAHLNLIGFVVMSVYGTYYALTPSAAAARLAWIHYALATLSVVVMIPGIVMAIREVDETAVKLGSLLVVASMALFLYTVLRKGVGRPETA